VQYFIPVVMHLSCLGLSLGWLVNITVSELRETDNVDNVCNCRDESRSTMFENPSEYRVRIIQLRQSKGIFIDKLLNYSLLRLCCFTTILVCLLSFY